MGLFSKKKKTEKDRRDENYRELYRQYYGWEPKGEITEDEKWELEMMDEDEWDEDEGWG